ncbi:MAG: tripartite tricarboxylate transporter substrate binding protein [Betaproteobacteria bacterium]|nr:tripartite tricarboxylate transporter substrate binding protein [Betaproteobacteria bacterium]
MTTPTTSSFGAHLLAIATLICGLLNAHTTHAQYPSKPIRFIVASQPGGIADLTPRLLAPRLQEALGQAIVIENRPGGGIIAGGETVAKAPPDGYTLLSATPQVAIVQSMVRDLSFDPRRDLAAVSLIGVVPNVLLVAPERQQKSIAELVAFARANPGKLNYSSTGAGTAVHLSAELFRYYAGINIVHVPFKGAAAAMTALMAGTVDITVDTLSSSISHIRSGKIRPLAVFSAQRAAALPAAPTMIESGYKDLEMNAWAGVVTTAKTPPEIIARLDNEIRKALEHKPTATAYDKVGLNLRYLGASEFGRFWDAEIGRFALAIKVSGAAKD